jgi:hypothetical protein
MYENRFFWQNRPEVGHPHPATRFDGNLQLNNWPLELMLCSN